MEILEEIFKDTKKRMQKSVIGRDEESQRKVDEIIKQMQARILDAFPRGRVSYKYQGTLEQALAELKGIANSTNTRSMQEMCDYATAIVSRTEKKIEEDREEEISEDERKREEQETFEKGREELRAGKKDVNRRNAESRLQDAVQDAFNKIKRAPLADMGLRAPEMFSVEVAVEQVFKAYPQLFNQLFDKNIDVVGQLLGKEYDDLEQVTLGDLKREMLKEEQAILEARAISAKRTSALREDVLDDEPLKPWDLRNYGTSREKVQNKTARVSQDARKAEDKPKDSTKNKPLETDWII